MENRRPVVPPPPQQRVHRQPQPVRPMRPTAQTQQPIQQTRQPIQPNPTPSGPNLPPSPPPPQPYGLQVQRPRTRRRWWIWGSIIAVIVIIILAIGSAFVWYRQALTAVNSGDTDQVRVVIDEGSTAANIAQTLKQHDLIRSTFAFELYTRDVTGMQAGGYMLSPAMNVSEIVQHLVEGKSDDFQVTFIPGSTIWDVKENLIETGYSEAEVESAFAADYNHPLFAGKPAGTSLEGYVFPDTYQVEGGASVEDILRRTFDEFYSRLQERDLIPAFERRDFSLYQAITLGSIIQKEVSDPVDERQVAQIFHKRLDEGMPLGADATFIYGALVLGVEPRVTLDSPYNTRQVGGLPPGPIANVSIPALEAVAHPAEGDFLYFVSGDDGTTHFTRTEEEHEEATRLYCHANCDIFRN